jgi:Protein kinase domain
MDRTTFLKNYRIRLQYDGMPYEPDSAGPAASYEAVDERTGEPVFVTLIPQGSIDPTEREAFEDRVASAQKLRHVNIAKVLDFGREGDDYVYVSERLPGETLASWVRSHGPMPSDAALRVGEQVVSVLSSAGFHKLPYPPIQPADVMLVPGQTAEGTWPLVKVTNFGLPALRARPEPQPIESVVPDKDKSAGDQRVNGQQFEVPTMDIRSEIYSLGVTLYFLLTGVALSAEALQHRPKFSGFPKPLRSLLGKFLHRDTDRRPKDLLVVTEMIREALGKIERRRTLSDRYGIPFRTSIPRPRKSRPRLLVRTAAAVGVLLLLAAIAPVIFPDSISKLARSIQKPKEVGVLVGVPDSSPGSSQAGVLAQAPRSMSSVPPTVASSQPVNPAAVPESSTPGTAAMTPNPFHVAPADVQQAQMANAQTQAGAATNSAENSAASAPDNPASSADANSSAQANSEQPPTAHAQSSSHSTEKSVASKSKRARASRNAAIYSQQGRTRSMRTRVTGITSDGRLILRLPSGRTAIVAPDEGESVPRHRNRVYIDRDQMFGPPPGFEPDYSPGD